MTDDTVALDVKIRDASERYHAARSRLLEVFPLIDEDTFYAVTCAAEEFGARHTRALIEQQPGLYGLPKDAFAKQEASMDLKARLQTFVELSEAMDWAVADQESTRTEDEPVWLIALHGRIAELRLDDQTLAYIDAPGERLAFEVALAGDNPQPTPTQKTIPRPRASVAFLISHIARYCVLCIQRRSSSVSKASCLGSTLMLARNQSPPCGFGDFSGRARQLPQYLCFGSCQLRNRQKPRLRLTAICVRQCFEC
ncbi:MAG: hypothetical protein SGJ17_06680 [Hyphomicrobiales bacterium]|nr:hypothetical protein [Hyphomicrobiales bacterium]